MRKLVRKTRAFTLVELLVVIAIIGILVALLLPAVQAAREAARRTQCTNQLRQMMLGVLNYESARNQLPAGMEVYVPIQTVGGIRAGTSTWGIEILPYLEESQMSASFNTKKPISDPENLHLIDNRLPIFVCPSDADPPGYTPTNFENAASLPADPNQVLPARSSYKGMAGQQVSGVFWSRPVHVTNAPTTPAAPRILSPFDIDFARSRRGPFSLVVPAAGLKRIKLRQVTDGQSNTVGIAEYHTITLSATTTWRPPAWGDWRAYSSMSDSTSNVNPTVLAQHQYVFGLADYAQCEAALGASSPHACERAVASTHSGGIVQVAVLDGSATALKTDIDPLVWAAAPTIAGGETNVEFSN